MMTMHYVMVDTFSKKWLNPSLEIFVSRELNPFKKAVDQDMVIA